MRITKMHGLGNDYIYVNGIENPPPSPEELAIRLSDRHFGVGGDGLIIIGQGKTGDFSMEMYNADGSRGAMCGNGIRCVGKYVYDHGLTKKTCLTIDTDSGPKSLELHIKGTYVDQVTVDMGVPAVSPSFPVTVGEIPYIVYPVHMGNPHAVIFCTSLEQIPLEQIGPILECDPHFPHRTNVEFVQISAPNHLLVRVWERGSGITLACGTGACACLAAAVKAGLCKRDVLVTLPGGTLELSWHPTSEHIFMTGPAVTVFHADLPDPLLEI